MTNIHHSFLDTLEIELVSTEPDGTGRLGILFKFPVATEQMIVDLETLPALIDKLTHLLEHAVVIRCRMES